MQADGFSLDDKRTPMIKNQELTTEADAIDEAAAHGTQAGAFPFTCWSMNYN
jgi:type I restriction enzyme M protein